MSTRDLLLIDLYRAARDGQSLALAARHAPVLLFDQNEPFLPLAAGYTIFREDGPSPSMERRITLRPEGLPPAAVAVEYAIWWDWDIHHLYELEHVWVYLDENERAVRLEASWHGEYRPIPLTLDGDRPVLLSEPGKHAFAPDPSWFHKRSAEFRREDTFSVSLHASVLVKEMFQGRIRQRLFDNTLVRSYLVQQAFHPTWDFSKKFTFRADWLVPWPVLSEWIPQRVNACLDRLEASTRAEEYRALHLAGSQGSLAGLQAAAASGAEAVLLPVQLAEDGRLTLEHDPEADLEAVFRYCKAEPVGACIRPVSVAAAEKLAGFVKAKGMEAYVIVLSPDEQVVSTYRGLVPNGPVAASVPSVESDPLLAAARLGAQFVYLEMSEQPVEPPPQWIERIHQAGLGVIAGPVRTAREATRLQRAGADILWTEM